MGRRSKKSRTSKKQHASSDAPKRYSSTENVAYYFLALIGAFIIIVLVFGLLSYLGIL